MPKSHEVALTPKQMEQLAKDAAICAGATILYAPRTRRVLDAANRILNVLKLDSRSE